MTLFIVLQIFIDIILLLCIILLKNGLNRKFELRPGEKLMTNTLKFTGNVEATKVPSGEPVDSITVLEYSNIKNKDENESKR